MRVGNECSAATANTSRQPFGKRSNAKGNLGPPLRPGQQQPTKKKAPLLDQQKQAFGAPPASAAASSETEAARSRAVSNNDSENGGGDVGFHQSLNRKQPCSSGIQSPKVASLKPTTITSTTRTTTVLDKENETGKNGSSNATRAGELQVTTTNTAVPNSSSVRRPQQQHHHSGMGPSSFRRRLRGTLSPKPTPITKKLPSTLDTSMTPSTLLSKEMEAVASASALSLATKNAGAGGSAAAADCFAADESLLLSPAPVLQQQRPTAKAKAAVTSCAAPDQQTMQHRHRNQHQPAAKPRDMVATVLQRAAASQQQQQQRNKATAMDCNGKATAINSSEASSNKPPPQQPQQRVGEEQKFPSGGNVVRVDIPPVRDDHAHLGQQTSDATTTASSCLASTKSVQSAVVSRKNVLWSAMHPEKRSPITTPGGICMDLSNMFGGAATGAAARAKQAPAATTDADMASTRAIKPRLPPPRRPTIPCSTKPVLPPQQLHHQQPVENNDDWAERQCETFINWLNFTLQPSEDTSNSSESNADGEEKSQSSERSALRTLLLHQQMASSRLRASQLYLSPEVQRMCTIVDSEINRGRISIRNDRNLYADLTMRNQVLELLLSYSTPWLRIGLEMIIGQPIEPESPHAHTSPIVPSKQAKRNNRGRIRADHRQHQQSLKVQPNPMRLALKRFIIQKVLSDDDTLKKYTHGKCIVPSGNFEVQYQAEMRKLVLHRLLALFLFLDRAKRADILDKAPRLFRIDSTVKSSQDVLLAFSRHFLAGEGNFIKHLSRVGLKVSYKQEPIEEVDFSVSNLAVDLRDGVRLARTAEILTNIARKSLLSKLRLPAVSRLQKLHNVGVAIGALRKFGVPIGRDILPHHIVDAHREVVLKLFWSIVAHCCLNSLVNVEQVEAEIQRIERLRGRTHDRSRPSQAIEDGSEALQQLLLRWSSAVCSTFGVPIRNLSTDFADGKAVCLLIHYYHPNLLRRSEIRTTSRDSRLKQTRGVISKGKLAANERANASLANSRLSELGGIPKMVPVMDASSPPDEKSILLCLSFMSSRLLESKLEIRSCVLIQKRYRKYRRVVVMERKQAAALAILQAWRQRRTCYYRNQRNKYGGAIQAIERFMLDHKANLGRQRHRRLVREAARGQAALRIQVNARRLLALRQFVQLVSMNRAAIVCQKQWRCFRARRLYVNTVEQQLQAAYVIQHFWIAHKQSSLRQGAAVDIQARVRGFLCRQRLLRINAAATSIQTAWRGFLCQVVYHIDLMDIVAVQSRVRGYFAIQEMRGRKHAATVISRSVASFVYRKKLELDKTRFAAAILCQRVVRRHIAIQHVSSLRVREEGSTKIQAVWRGYLAQTQLRRAREASCRIQALVRGRREGIRFVELRSSAKLVQCAWRGFSAREMFKDHVRSIVKAQACIRMYLACLAVSHYRKSLVAATSIQSLWRTFTACGRYRSVQCATCLIQRIFRGFRYRRLYLKSWKVAVLIQACVRGSIERNTYRAYRLNALLLQRYWRGHVARSFMIRSRNAAIAIQSAARMMLSRSTEFRKAVAAKMLQRYWRGFSAVVKYTATVKKVVLAQSLTRRRLANLEICRRRYALQLLQLAARKFLARRVLENLKIEWELEQNLRYDSCRTIQKTYRGYSVRREILALHSSALAIQTAYRRYRALANYLDMRYYVIIVQSVVRRWRCMREVTAQNKSILVLQCFFRHHLAKKCFDDLRLRKAAATLIQDVYRGYRSRVNAAREASATKIQSIWRSYSAHIEYLWSVMSAMTIQRFFRLSLSRLEEQRRKYLSATVLQSVARMFFARRDFKLQRRSAVTIQKNVRGFGKRKEGLRMHAAALCVQNNWRTFSLRSSFVRSVLAAMAIQTATRAFLVRARVERLRVQGIADYLLRYRSAKLIQNCYRQHVYAQECNQSARKVQGAARRFLRMRVFSKLRNGVIRLQAAARGRRTRSRRCKKVATLALRVQKANIKSAEEPKLRLGYRCSNALKALLKMTRLSELHAAISTLETATRLSRVCCAAFADANAPSVLFSLIRTCNRSLPHAELLYTILLTLKNVANYSALLPCMATTRGAEVFLDLVQMFRDRDGIFFLASSLLERILPCSRELSSICSSKENSKRLRHVLLLSERRLDAQQNNGRKPSSRRLRGGIRALKGVIHLVDTRGSP